jgi:hypothetical protein
MPDDAAELESDGDLAAGREVRVDAAHALRRSGDRRAGVPPLASVAAETLAGHADLEAAEGGASEGTPPEPELADLDFIAANPAMLAEHAASLADRLQVRLAEVDRRESRLNSQEAEFDSRIRTARLWVEQCETDIAQRTQQLDELERDLAERQELAVAQIEHADELAQRLKELAEREKAAATLQIELQLGATELQTKLDALEFETAVCRTRQQELDDARQKYEERQRELDAREARLYTEQELLAAGQAAAAGELAEQTRRESRVAAREAGLDELQRRLTEQASELEFRRAELDRDTAARDQQAVELAAADRRLQFRQREIDAAIKRFERLGVVEQKMVEMEQQAAAFAMRRSYLDSAELLLAERQTQLDDQERELEQARLAFENQATRERRSLVAESERAQSERDAHERELQRRDQSLDQREQSLEQLADQLRATQRESLEARLATEETWLQLQGALAPAALTRSIAQVRGRLADHFQLAADDVQIRRSELERIRAELAEQLSALDERRQHLQRWAIQQQGEIEQQAARLVARERQLDDQEREFQRLQQRWNAERSEYQEQIRQLLAELRAPSHAAA